MPALQESCKAGDTDIMKQACDSTSDSVAPEQVKSQFFRIIAVLPLRE